MAELFRADKKCDRALLAAVLVITVLGMVYLYSTGAYYGQARFHDAAYYFKKQFLAVSLGLTVMAGVSCTDYHLVTRYAGLIYFLSLALSTAVLFVGQEYNGSKRWLALGPLSFQPSELAKVAVILLLAGVISRQGNKRAGLLFAVRIFLYVLPIVALVATNNLSSAIIIMGIDA